MKPRKIQMALAVAICMLTFAATVPAEDPPRRPTLGDALRASMKPVTSVNRYAPYIPKGGKGIVQRSLLDFSGTQKNVQIALVVDGTATMRADIRSLKDTLRQFVESIKQQVSTVSSNSEVDVRIAVVVYRDLWQEYDFAANRLVAKRADPVEILASDGGSSKRFDSYDDKFEQIVRDIESIKLAPGDPGFPEQVDRGVYAALTKLNWIDAEDVTRLIIVAGDAPPWPEELTSYDQHPAWWKYWEKRRTLRGHSTRELTDLAKQKKIKIFSIACSSGAHDKAVAQRHLPELNDFFKTLAHETGGGYLNLWNSNTIQTVEQLKDATKAGPRKLLELKHFTQKDVDRRRGDKGVHVAVLPPMPLQQIQFTSTGYEEKPAYDLAVDLVYRLQNIDGRRVTNLTTVKREWTDFVERIDAGDSSKIDESVLPGFVRLLGVDLLIWGERKELGGKPGVVLRVFDQDASVLSTEWISGRSSQLAGKALVELVSKLEQAGTSGHGKAAAFAKLYRLRQARELLQEKFAENDEAHKLLLDGYDLLEQAVEFSVGDKEGIERTRKAQTKLQQSLKADAGNPFAWLLLSNSHQNLGESDQAIETLKQAIKAAETRPVAKGLRLEIEADHALFVEGDPIKAIGLYQQLTKESDVGHSKTALRALWMLAGLYLGDWGSTKAISEQYPAETERRDLARECILDMLVYWPDSAEAAYYGKFISPRLPAPARPLNRSELRITHEVHHMAVPVNRSKIARSLGKSNSPDGS